MTTLSPIDPDTDFMDLEGLICDAANMTDVLTNALHEHFSKAPPKGGFLIDADDGHRLFFLASMVIAMTDKARDAYYVALKNEREAKEKRRPGR
ncbi:hypothetical protein [Shinella sp.]|uniref:hypothetical protein n=1 Tax=Shinella sp. TaxID=1870904 RepID=UPI0028AD23B1|nr:hypothetical protein [Shinella sp.]